MASPQNRTNNMKILTTFKTCLCGAALLTTGLSTYANSLQRADIAADPAWIFHLDVDGLRPTAVGQYLLTEMEKPEAQAKLAAFQSIFNLDLRTQLHGFTLYSRSLASEDGVLIVYADLDVERITTLAKGAQDYQSTEHSKHVIHNWIDDKRKPKDGVQPRVYAAVQGKRIIFGQKEQQVAQALDVLDGVSQNLLASKNLPELGATGANYIIEAAARKLDLPSSDPTAAVFKLSKMARLQIGQTQGQMNATVTLEANDDDVAGNIVMIAQGLVALTKIQKEKPVNVKIAEAIALRQEGPRVVLNVKLPLNDVVDMMKADAERKARKSDGK
jgi:hypothetical protein